MTIFGRSQVYLGVYLDLKLRCDRYFNSSAFTPSSRKACGMTWLMLYLYHHLVGWRLNCLVSFRQIYLLVRTVC
ncbi:hypothetical protein H6G76_06210 [Nostoc sp. FACHB-152]|uniref:hypothetical protein n=1 Tax=unclassified Nostoc TaxID=2593658 RepID=UPI001684FAAF|nr:MULTISPECIES: hypothetical protein [unclassified Nostoc]MBD2446766.1 hypothetical protein [Nostoc sp. FACHB-152]MBD2466613.1 hypothetical protein [Nostoc sp. FACHB-145]